MIVGSLDLFCGEDIDYAQKLMEAGVFTELYVEPGVPHAYDALEGTTQTERVNALRDNAKTRMFGNKDLKASDEETEYSGLYSILIDE